MSLFSNNSQSQADRGRRRSLAELRVSVPIIDLTPAGTQRRLQGIRENVQRWMNDQERHAQQEDGMDNTPQPPPTVRAEGSVAGSRVSSRRRTERSGSPMSRVRSHREKKRERAGERKKSHGGNRDADPGVPEPPRGSLQRNISNFLEGPPPPKRHKPSPLRQMQVQVPQAQAQQVQVEPARVEEIEVQEAEVQEVEERIEDEIVVATEPREDEVVQILDEMKPPSMLFMIAPELRDKIYGYLLVSQKPINVKGLWTEQVRYRTGRRRGGRRDEITLDDNENTIDTRILRVCRQAFTEGVRVLYGQNRFVYNLRDPDRSGINLQVAFDDALMIARRATAKKNQSASRTGICAINFEKYAPHFRHMAIELDFTRSDDKYMQLMERALLELVSTEGDAKGNGARKISLDTLTITISPRWYTNPEAVRRAQMLADNAIVRSSRRNSSYVEDQRIVVHNNKVLSVVRAFSAGSIANKALQNIDANFLRINLLVHKNTVIYTGKDDNINVQTGTGATAAGGAGGSVNDNDVGKNNSDSEDEIVVGGAGNSLARRGTAAGAPGDGTRHIERTIDLRFLPRQMEALEVESEDGKPSGSKLWERDVLMQEARAKRGSDAAEALRTLRKSFEDACFRGADYAIKKADKGWEDHEVAEERRRARQAREQRRWDGYDGVGGASKKRKRDEEEDGDDEDTDDESGSGSESDDDDSGDDSSGDDSAGQKRKRKGSSNQKSKNSNRDQRPRAGKSLILSFRTTRDGGMMAYRD